MKNNKSKSGSIRLITIINILIIIVAMMYSINIKYNNVQIAKAQKNIESNTIELASATRQINDNSTEVTSRSATSRKELNTNTENDDNNEKTEENNETKSNENIEIENNSQVEEQKNVTVQEETEQKEEIVYTNIEDVKISQDMDLTVKTGLSREDFMKLMAGVKADTSGFFEENAGTIYDLCQTYEINEIFFCGLISAESGWNIASNHRRTYNYISLMSNGKLIPFSSVYDGLEGAAKALHTKYLTSGGRFYHGKTLVGVKKCFCPASDTWVSLVYGRMKQII